MTKNDRATTKEMAYFVKHVLEEEALDIRGWEDVDVGGFFVDVPNPVLTSLIVIDDNEEDLRERKQALQHPDFCDRLRDEVERLMKVAWAHGYATAQRDCHEKHQPTCTCCPLHGPSD